MELNDVLGKIEGNRSRYLSELAELLKIPSVSTYPHLAAEVRRAAEWIFNHARRIGLQAYLYETEGHPVVYAWRCPHPDKPTLLVYGHYDVQPAEPRKEWVTPPFSPSIRGGYIYARGASDDKGQLFTYLKAIEAILAVAGELPVNVKLLIEGEEEIGSPDLPKFLQRHLSMLEASVIAISDGSKFAEDIPAITYGLRGLSYLQIEVCGPRIDLHSGSWGGIVANPVQALAEILSKLKNPDGTIAIPGFYEDVVDLDPREREEMASLPLDEEKLKQYLGVDELIGEQDHSILERKTTRPTLDINGIWGGFSAPGVKTIIPAQAGAKISMRLVPNQSPAKINKLVKKHIEDLKPPGVKVKVHELHSAEPILVDRDREEVQAAVRAITTGFGKKPVFIREGGSIPIVNLLRKALGIETILLMGWGNPDDGAHSPNERFSIQDFFNGIRSVAALFYEMAG